MNADAALRELEGMRALARSLVHGDAEADDLLQEAAVLAIEHPPELDRPVRPWFAVVLRNLRRMDLRGQARRRQREEALAPPHDAAHTEPRADEALDRARTLELLASALVALDEPFRTTVIRRYLDGLSAAEIARAAGVPAGTVRWRLKTGLARLRAALETREPRWQRALVPLIPGVAVKSKVGTVALALLVLLLAAAGVVIALRARTGDDAPASTVASASGSAPAKAPVLVAPGHAPATADAGDDEPRPPLPGQNRARIEIAQLAGGAVSGHVINWSTGDGVANAELTFIGDGGATTVRSREGGAFELAPPAPGRYSLTTIGAPGFLPYAPELLHSTVHVELAKDRAVRGITVYLFPALDYSGRVVDARKAPVAGAKVRLLGTPAGEQAIDKLETEWTTDRNGEFTFHAADFAVFEAVHGAARGWARLDGDVMTTKRMTIEIDAAPPRDRTIAGKVVDAAGKPVADVLVRAGPVESGPPAKGPPPARATSFATSGTDGAFTLGGLDDGLYDLDAHAEGRAPAHKDDVASGTRGVTLVLDAGQPIAGIVTTSEGEPVGAYTLLVHRQLGAARSLVSALSIVDPSGRFEARVDPSGKYEVMATASGRAPSEPVPASPGAKDVRLVVTGGATLRGTVRDADGSPLPYARVMREARGGGASAQPANAGTVARDDGSFELTGIPPGPVSIFISAGGHHPKIEAGMTATDGATLGPLDVRLQRLKDGETPSLELVGIGVQLSADGDALKVTRVIEGGGAAAAGIVVGDHVTAVDGAPVAPLGVDGAVARIRGAAGTTVSVTLRRDDKAVTLVVERRKLRAG
ncbi:MAG: sigma-70 family RNA polymerase sigma factor [Deltaproteobacteria bacterium]|nr:sigma-70 family RNA polymerase sigma factor [Deltaproteobacteria bacterium]